VLATLLSPPALRSSRAQPLSCSPFFLTVVGQKSYTTSTQATCYAASRAVKRTAGWRLVSLYWTRCTWWTEVGPQSEYERESGRSSERNEKGNITPPTHQQAAARLCQLRNTMRVAVYSPKSYVESAITVSFFLVETGTKREEREREFKREREHDRGGYVRPG
jgi:hypothetical protein